MLGKEQEFGSVTVITHILNDLSKAPAFLGGSSQPPPGATPVVGAPLLDLSSIQQDVSWCPTQSCPGRKAILEPRNRGYDGEGGHCLYGEQGRQRLLRPFPGTGPQEPLDVSRGAPEPCRQRMSVIRTMPARKTGHRLGSGYGCLVRCIHHIRGWKPQPQGAEHRASRPSGKPPSLQRHQVGESRPCQAGNAQRLGTRKVGEGEGQGTRTDLETLHVRSEQRCPQQVEDQGTSGLPGVSQLQSPAPVPHFH